MGKFLQTILLSATFFFSACNSSDVEDVRDVAEGVERQAIDRSIMGINAYAEEAEFGSPCEQFLEIRDQLGLKFVRILFNWSTAVQPTPSSNIDWSFYDLVARCIPAGVDALVVLNALPAWMNDANNWDGNNPRLTFVNKWVAPAVQRYRSNGRIIGFQILNEPNMLADADNRRLLVAENPENYVELLAAAYSVIKDLAPRKLVLNAATTSIVQNFPETLEYNKKMLAAGALNFVDRYAIHYYGIQFENLIFSGGVAEVLNSLSKPIWVTESGKQGVDQQLEYVETVWPYVKQRVPGIERFYYYQFISRTPPEQAYGLRNPSNSSAYSDLYRYLSEQQE